MFEIQHHKNASPTAPAAAPQMGRTETIVISKTEKLRME
jgi:hypothetical protein